MDRIELSFPRGPRRTCTVRVGPGLLARLPSALARIPRIGRVVLVADDVVAALYAAPLAERIVLHGRAADLLTFAAGERSKVRETKAALEDRLLELGAGGDTLIVAVGGGVTGDLAGFLAATWHRGVPVVHVPTTLLAMVDSALGGKTGVDLPGGKNLVGAFHQPLEVWADPTVLTTLDDATYGEGLAEAVKSAAVADARLFARLERSAGRLLAREPREVRALVAACLRIKARIVLGDELDRGRRAALNFGHTVAHAIEAAGGYRIRHGAAVALGLVAEAQLACEFAGFPRGHAERLAALLGQLAQPDRLPRASDLAAIVAATRRDKKARRGATRYALPSRLGRMPARILTAAPEERLRAALERLAR